MPIMDEFPDPDKDSRPKGKCWDKSHDGGDVWYDEEGVLGKMKGKKDAEVLDLEKAFALPAWEEEDDCST